LLVRDVLSSHNPQRIEVFAYNASPLRDWVTEHIAQHVQWREVGQWSDEELAAQIRQD
jgi:predicted O-linked N-acetylglucosamine transferase (SPINDLY family)